MTNFAPPEDPEGSSPLTRGKPSARASSSTTWRLIPAHAGKTSRTCAWCQPPWAHPRSRGENCVRSLRNTGVLGASPLTRGKRDVQPPSGVHEGRIPAHAGKTSSSRATSATYRAHPRSRGENAPTPKSIHGDSGASPLTRGKLPDCGGGRKAGRRIPAHAGKTTARQSPPPTSWAHPRSRGENRRGRRSARSPSGASPLTRGKPAVGGLRIGSPGRIPAHAGKTTEFQFQKLTPPAHPRSRGENGTYSHHAAFMRGASPLTRGKLHGDSEHGQERGRIPAHAGKTRWGSAQAHEALAHPRSRGENGQDGHDEGAPAGASPLTRGKQAWEQHNYAVDGRIPAHAGKTPGTPPPRIRPGAHPRSRGENKGQVEYRSAVTGASPLTRGKLDRSPGSPRPQRRIPAHAGKTLILVLCESDRWAHPRSRGENPAHAGRRHHWWGASPLTRGKRTEPTGQLLQRGRIPAHAGKTPLP